MNNTPTADMNQILDTIRKYHKPEQIEINELLEIYIFLEQNTPAYKDHALSAAQFIAEKRFDYTVVLAAFLHNYALSPDADKLFSSLKVNEETIQILQVYKKIHESLIHNCHRHGIDMTLKQDPLYMEALFIQIAETISLLERSDSAESEDQLLTITDSAKNHLIPELKNIRAFMVVDILENLCMKIEKKNLYTAILNRLSELNESNGVYQKEILTQFGQIFDTDCRLIPKPLRSNEQNYIRKISWSSRSVSSIARHLEKNTDSLPYDFQKLMDKTRLPYHDITLIIADDAQKHGFHPKDIFFNYYRNYLHDALQIYILGYYETTYQDSDYLLLCDKMNNLYRIFIKTEEEYLCYQLGTTIQKDTFRMNQDVRDDSLIKVFKMDGTAAWIEKGATVLDFAFKLHENLGLHFQHAIINNRKNKPCPAYTRLNNGDSVTIVTNSKITPDLQWFKYLKTDNAVSKLIRYFKNTQKE